MIEKVLTLYDREELCIKGLMIIKVDKNDYLTRWKPITLYSNEPLTSDLLAHREILTKRHIKICDLKKDLKKALSSRTDTNYLALLEPFVLKSDNKNKSSRNKRMLKYMNLSHLERNDIYEQNFKKGG